MLKIIIVFLVSVVSVSAWSNLPPEIKSKPTLAPNSSAPSTGLKKELLSSNNLPVEHATLSKNHSPVTYSHHSKTAGLLANCAIEDAIATPNEQLSDFLINMDAECTQDFFYGDIELLSDFYTLDRMVQLASDIQARAEEYELEDATALDRLLSILRGGYYNRYYEPDEFDWDEFTPELRQATLSVLNAFYDSNLFWTLDDDIHAGAVYEWFLLIDAAESRVEFIPMFKQLLSRFNEDFLQSHHWSNVYNSFFYEQIGRGLHRQRFIDAIIDDTEFFDRLELATTRQWLLTYEDGYYNYLIYNTYFYIGKMHGFDVFVDRSEAVLSQLLDQEARFSYLWMSVARSINGWSDCERFSAYNICKESVKPELEQILFPNTFSFDDGRMVVRTSLGRTKVESLYYAAKQVQAQFFRLTQNDAPLPDDVNDVLTMVVYDSPESYDLYQYFLNEIDTDNGGIYIEQSGTFYTYERTPEDSIYTLEELFRHEYTHYLQARFSIHGIFGETEFYEENRITWLNEGSAEYLAHATQHDGVLQRKTIVARIANDQERLSINEIVYSGYNGGFKFYRYGSLLVDFLNKHHKTTLTNIFNAVRNNDVVAYDELISAMATDTELESEYQQYLNAAVENLELLSNPSTDYVPSRSLIIDSVDQVQQLLVAETMLVDAECTEFAASLEMRVRCTGLLTSNSESASNAFNQVLDTSIQQLVNIEDEFDWVNLICWYGEITSVESTSQANYTCETSIRPEDTERVNLAPSVSIDNSTRLYDEYEATLNATVLDLDSTTLTYQWEQLTGPALTFDDTRILQPTVIADKSIEGDYTVELKLTVDDGQESSSKTVTYRLFGYNSRPEVDAGENRELFYGDSIELVSEAFDPEGEELSYRWEYESDLEITLESETSPNLTLTIPEVDDERTRIVRFVLNVSDGESETYDVVDLTISKRPDTTAPIITLIGATEMTISQGETFIDPGATATDDRDGDLSTNIIVTGSVDSRTVGTYMLMYQVSDNAGNASTPVMRTVNVADTTLPVITLIGPAEMVIEQGSEFSDPGATAFDNNDGDLTGNIEISGRVDSNTVGIYTLFYYVMDSAGNNAILVSRTVNVVDTTAPIVTLNGQAQMVIELGSEFSDPGATAFDSNDGDLTGNIEISGRVDSNTIGTYTLFYYVMDNAGNNAIPATRTVNVVDTTAPTVTLNGQAQMVIAQGSEFSDPGATAFDSNDGDLTDSIEISGRVDSNTVGTYTLFYYVMDSAGNNAVPATRTVTVTDLTVPVITLNGDSNITISHGSSFSDPGATAIDNNDGDITDQIRVIGSVDSNKSGEYILTYHVSDNSGNAATPVTRKVVVKRKKGSGGSLFYLILALVFMTRLRINQ